MNMKRLQFVTAIFFSHHLISKGSCTRIEEERFFAALRMNITLRITVSGFVVIFDYIKKPG